MVPDPIIVRHSFEFCLLIHLQPFTDRPCIPQSTIMRELPGFGAEWLTKLYKPRLSRQSLHSLPLYERQISVEKPKVAKI
jgi:hypothetical protein